MLEALKAWAVDQHLGEENFLEMSIEEVHEFFKKAEEEMIRKAGGTHKWNKLSDIKKAERSARMIEGFSMVSCHSAELFHIARIDSSIRAHKFLVNVNVGKNLIVAKPQLPVELFNALVTARSNFM